MGEEVVLFDIVPRSHLINDINEKVKVFPGDLDNWSQVMMAVKRYHVDTIYHSGALLSAMGEESPLATYKANANGTLNVLEAARFFEVKTVIFLSTIATYGPGLEERVPVDAVQYPISMYGVTKVFGERLGEYYHSKFGLNFRAVRLPSAIGPGRGSGGVSAYSSLIVQEPAAGRKYEVYVREQTMIPLLYINDAVSGMIKLASARESDLKRRVYSLQGFSPTAGELAGVVRKYVPDAKIVFRPQPEMVHIAESWPRELDDSCARNDWGWHVEYPLDRAIQEFVKEFGANRGLYESPLVPTI